MSPPCVQYFASELANNSPTRAMSSTCVDTRTVSREFKLFGGRRQRAKNYASARDIAANRGTSSHKAGPTIALQVKGRLAQPPEDRRPSDKTCMAAAMNLRPARKLVERQGERPGLESRPSSE